MDNNSERKRLEASVDRMRAWLFGYASAAGTMELRDNVRDYTLAVHDMVYLEWGYVIGQLDEANWMTNVHGGD